MGRNWKPYWTSREAPVGPDWYKARKICWRVYYVPGMFAPDLLFTKFVDVRAKNRTSALRKAERAIRKLVGPRFTITEIFQIYCDEVKGKVVEALDDLRVLTADAI